MVPTSHLDGDMMERRIYLNGFMGSGKSTIARELGEQRGWPYRDLDAVIEKRENTTIPEIFEEVGEQPFRDMETRYLEEFSGRTPPFILACGGGTPIRRHNREIMGETGVAIHLDVDVKTIMDRIGEDPHRPLFQNREQVESLFETRQQFYEQLPYTVDTTECSPQEVIEKLLVRVPFF
ncbi:MAG: shikimate kinase [bacterium]